jgi:hypothetical protein
MADNKPALFYFWSHDVIEELRTDTCKALVERADVIFLEGVTPDVSISAEIERDINNCSADGVLTDKLRGTLRSQAGEEIQFMLELTKGTPKRYVLEKYPEADFDFEREEAESNLGFLMYGLEEAMQLREDFFMKSRGYNIPKEKTAAGNIIAIDGTVLAIFGAAHPDIQKMVMRSRPTEVHFPYPDYPNSYNCQEMADFNRTGVLDKELFLRGAMEMVVNAALPIELQLSKREKNLLAYRYAGLIPVEKIAGYKDYLHFCISLSGASPAVIFESFLKKEGLPLVPEVLAEIRKV